MKKKKFISIALAALLIMLCAGCASNKADAPATEQNNDRSSVSETAQTDTPISEETEITDEAEPSDEAKPSEKNGEIYILATGDVHCGIDMGFGYAGLKQVRDNLESQGYETILVDDGDSIQGRPVGTVSKGGLIIELMNDLQYDVAIPGNHEFDYGMERFLELTKQSSFPYISCNFNLNGELIFDPYIIKEVSGIKIAFVGATTPETLVTSTPEYFMDDNGNYVYGFMQDKSGEALYAAIQDAIDSARNDGADIVCLMGHLGNEAECEPWTYADVISNTSGIDIFLDGHSHDADKVTMLDKEGNEVTRIACGTALNGIGYTHINAEGKIDDAGVWNWNNEVSAPELFDIQNDIRKRVDEVSAELDEELGRVVATTSVDLIMEDPNEIDDNGRALRIIRLSETNLGDLVADAYKDQSGADIAFVNGGGIRTNIKKGDITYGDIINVHPFGNMLTVIEVSGQQILDALEWGSKDVPGEHGGFIQVSGLSYEIDSSIESPCIADENSAFVGIKGKRRVKNVLVNNEPIDPSKKYTLAGHDYMLLSNGDGYTMFDGSPVLQESVKLDNQVLIDYIVDTLGGEVGSEYTDPYGQGRIIID
ncbi:MAG: bifunctional metallophosphatase/5'-nucleotidase [Lachnospiraceae bacterium]|nr:bifunctional metallophosphatase/5'-nucleotidase [Lachnospiraceae bacterium]